MSCYTKVRCDVISIDHVFTIETCDDGCTLKDVIDGQSISLLHLNENLDCAWWLTQLFLGADDAVNHFASDVVGQPQ